MQERAVGDPPVLILDEATSSIDTRTESLVQAGMDALMQGRTTFVIAHRLSTVRNSDCIMVLEQGRIIERGTHDELIAKRANIISSTQETSQKKQHKRGYSAQRKTPRREYLRGVFVQ